MPASTMQLDLEASTGLTGVRAGAWQRWKKTGWPDQHSEQWRFTRLSVVEKMNLRPAHNAAAVPGVRALSAKLPDNAVVLYFDNGVVDVAGLSDLPAGVSAIPLDGNDTDLERLADLVPQSHPISNLSLAAMSSGVKPFEQTMGTHELKCDFTIERTMPHAKSKGTERGLAIAHFSSAPASTCSTLTFE